VSLLNGVYNAIFIILLFINLIALDYIYSIGDRLIKQVYTVINIIQPNAISLNAYTTYFTLRTFYLEVISYFVVPFLLLISFASSFINRHVNIVTFLISSMSILLITPFVIYIFAQYFTNLLSVSILDPVLATTYLDTYFNNFLYILVINLLLSLASFVWVEKQGAG